MPDQALYLFKGARRPRYRRENLHLLAAERGTVIEVSYNRSWVAPKYLDPGAIERGTPAVFVFCERPYDRFVPVRGGEVVSTVWDDLGLRLRVFLKNYLAVDEVDPETFARMVQHAAPRGAPPHKFVAPKVDGVDFEAFFDEREADGWRRAVEGVVGLSARSADDPYGESVFFRPAGVRLPGGDVLVARQASLDEGERATIRLQFHNPHLSDEDVADLSLEAHAVRDGLAVEAPGGFPLEGIVELNVEGRGGEPELQLEILPSPGRHTHLLERFRRPGRKERTDVATAGAEAVPQEKVLDLFDTVRRNTERRSTEDWIDVLKAFERALPDAQTFPELRALAMAGQDRVTEALEILDSLNPETLGDDARFLLFRERAVRGDEEPYRLVEELDLNHERRFDRLLEEMEAMDGRMLNRIVPELVRRLAEGDQAREVVERFGSRLTDVEPAVGTAEHLAYHQERPEEAFRFLNRQRIRLGSNAGSLIEALVDLAELGGESRFDAEVQQALDIHIGNLARSGAFDEAEEMLRRAGPSLDDGARRRLHHELADACERRDERDRARWVMVEFAYACLDRGELEAAGRAVERAVGMWVRDRPDHDGEMPQLLREAKERVEGAWKACEDLVEWRKSAEERRRERLRERYLNGSILIAGGVKNPEWIDHLEDLTGAEVDWCEHFRGDGDALSSYAERIRSGSYDLVVHYLQKTGHGLGDVLRPACEEAGVSFVPARSAGRRGVVEALEGVTVDA